MGWPPPAGPQGRGPRAAERGQVLVIFAGGIVLFLLLVSVVVDVSWYFTNTLRIQRAADAAALAGAVYLPGDRTTAYSRARAEATKNGYTDGANATITPLQDAVNSRQLNVTISSEVETFFMRVVGIDSISATLKAKAEYVLPVPMGSPENYYGTFGLMRTPDGGTYTYDTTRHNSGWLSASATRGTNTWTSSGNVYVSDNQHATTSQWDLATSSTARQAWGSFGISFPSGGNVTSVTIRGIELGVEASLAGSGTAADCRFQLDLSWNNGVSWTSGSGTGDKTTPALTTTDPADPYHVLGTNADLWGRTSWTTGEMSNTNLQVRAQPVRPGSSACNSTVLGRLDHLRIRVTYDVTRSTFHPDQEITDPYGGAVNARGLWGTMHNSGAEDINGDAYLPRYETRTSRHNDEYTPDQHYDYAVEIPAGATGGEVWVFDPVFCATGGSGQYGTGDRWFGGTSTASAFFYLYDTKSTLYNLNDDDLVASSGNLFRSIRASDADLGGPTGSGIADCSAGATSDPADGRYWHNRWWRLASGLSGGPGGKVYRIRTTSTDSADNDSNGHNSFAFWVGANGGVRSPRVYGVGAMQAFTPLDGGGSAVFYLAQIEAVHAGKTMEIRLWDPGDTGNLPASLRILMPTSGGWQAASLSYTSRWGTSNSGRAACNGLTGSGTSITTNSGGNNRFNGCWLTITIPIASTYTAPQDGWWKIEYVMGGSSSDNAFDLTTWEVNIRGNPVHLKVP